MIHDGLLKSILRVSLIGVNSVLTLLIVFLSNVNLFSYVSNIHFLVI